MMINWLGFGDLDLIFKVTAELKLPNLSQKVLVRTISHELVGSFQRDLHGYNIGTLCRADLVLVTLTYFSRSLLGLNCQIWAKRCLCAQNLMNQQADFNQICMDITFGHDKKLNRSQPHNWNCHHRLVWEVGDICFLWKYCYIFISAHEKKLMDWPNFGYAL